MTRRGIAAVSLALAASLVVASASSAATLRVTRTSDPVPGDCRPRDCSLREALLEANASVGVADRIVLPERRRDYRLTRPGTSEDAALDGDLDVTGGPLTILHPGKGRATIDAGGLGERVLDVFAPATVRKLVLTGAVEDGEGGGIRATDDLRLAGTIVKGNRAAEILSTDGLGGGIYHNSGRLVIVGSTISGNRADDEAGALEALGNELIIRRSRFLGNVAVDSRAGGIYSYTDITRISDSTFSGNRAPTTGGALYVNDGPVEVTDSTFAHNRVTDSSGGAIHSFGELQVTNSTFWRNRATGAGGAIYNGGDASLFSSTVARNVADSDGDGSGPGGGIYNSAFSIFDVANSVIALNDQVGGDADDCGGIFDSFGGNLRTDGTDCAGFTEPGDAIRPNPKLGRLARNGGPTQTIALKRGSPAIGRAVGALSPEKDQRGRNRDSDPDSGAYER